MDTYTDLMHMQHEPVVAIDDRGLFFYVNKIFEETYGWTEADLLGKMVTTIMPPHMRDAHNIGLSRFLTTEKSTLLHKPLDLPITCKNGLTLTAEHYIVGEKIDGKWKFAARISLHKHE